MKCVNCGRDANFKERSDGSCPSCHHTFAFEPKSGALFTDSAFEHAIDTVSGRGTVKFLPQHVRWQLERQRKPSRATLVLAVLVGIGGLAASLWTLVVGTPGDAAAIFVLAAGVVVSLVLLSRRPGAPRLTQRSFDTLWQRWLKVNGPPAGLIEPRRELPRRAVARADEFAQYSFDRAVICDRPELVEVLLANRFHFENNCAVLSFGGYPEAAFEVVRRMLRNNPKLLVLAVHDATPFGCGMAWRLAHDPEWFKDFGRVVDVGLRPAHQRFFPNQVDRAWEADQAVSGQGISDKEAAWLRRYRIEATAIRPEQLVKRLYRALSESEKSEDALARSDDSGVFYLGTDADASDGGSDSFG